MNSAAARQSSISLGLRSAAFLAAHAVAADLARCDREMEEIQQRPDVVSGAAPAFLVTLGMEDWRREKELILKYLPLEEWPYRWAWRKRPLRRFDERQSRYYGWPCRVVARARRMNSVHVEFPDGFVCVTSANGLRKRGTTKYAQTTTGPVGEERQRVAGRGATGKPAQVLVASVQDAPGMDRPGADGSAQDCPSVAPPTFIGVNAGRELGADADPRALQSSKVT